MFCVRKLVGVKKGESITMQVLLRFILIGISGTTFFVSCMTSSNQSIEKNKNHHPSEERTMTIQLIIKFKDTKINPTRVDFLKQLSQDANATLQYLRPMSGGAHVFSVGNIRDSVSAVIQRLSARPDILYVEPDNIIRHQ
jgi:hypothetical protein